MSLYCIVDIVFLLLYRYVFVGIVKDLYNCSQVLEDSVLIVCTCVVVQTYDVFWISLKCCSISLLSRISCGQCENSWWPRVPSFPRNCWL